VERRKHEVSGLGSRQRHLDGFQVAHLADQDDVGVLTKHVPQRGPERVRVRANLALIHQAALVAVQELDRVLHRHDVGAA